MSDASALLFVDLKSQHRRVQSGIRRRFEDIFNHCQFLNGPEVSELEQALAQTCRVQHVLATASGTDALLLALLAVGVRAGDAVAVPAFSFVAAAEAVALLGAIPVFVDVERDSKNLCGRSLAAVLERSANLKAVIAVDLFGLPAENETLRAQVKAAGLWLIADAAQALGAATEAGRVGQLADITCTSFYPTKPLGGYGDGGAVMTDNPELAAIVGSLRNHGSGDHAYDHIRVGITGRLDSMQAAVLLEKLTIFADEQAARTRLAEQYQRALSGLAVFQAPRVPLGWISSWSQYTLTFTQTNDRDSLQRWLASWRIPSRIYYPRSLPQQPAYARYRSDWSSTDVSDALGGRVLSIPCHPYLGESSAKVIAAIRSWSAQSSERLQQ